MTSRLCLWFLFLAASGLWASCGAEHGPRCPPVDTDIVLPQDQAPHHNLTEWWYYTGHLWNAAGARHGFELVIFQLLVAGDQVSYISHFAITDVRNQQHHYDQRLEMVGSVYPDFDLAVGDWTIRGDGTTDQLRASMEGYAIELAGSSTKPPACHGNRGLIDMGGGHSSYYYSKTMIEVVGTLTIGDQSEPVTGTGWMDHQWGDFYVFDSDGWDWFSAQLDDGTEVMIFLLHPKGAGPKLTGGTLVDANGCQRHFTDFNLQAKGSWESPTTQTVYPMGWSIEIPDQALALEVTPTVVDQEIDSRTTTLNVYWEGEVEISGTRQGVPVTGLGYVELAGYGPWGPGF